MLFSRELSDIASDDPFLLWCLPLFRPRPRPPKGHKLCPRK